MTKHRAISIDVSTGPYSAFIEEIIRLAHGRCSAYVCVANVHMAMEAHLKKHFAVIVNQADLVAPDGMPLVRVLRIIHGIRQERVAGMDLLPDLIAEAKKQHLSIFFYGSTDDVLERIVKRIEAEHPHVRIAGVCSPPFRPLSDEEEDKIVGRINGSGAHLVMVALGCPKQEIWMARMRGRINAVMLGIGGALPVYAGMQRRAPTWMQRASLEWLYRLCQEPRRLFRRYLTTNTLFLLLLAREWWVVKALGRKDRIEPM
jgi:N-acetylglucosaminyldiphosphoundecaprenol N-acetyl-beta-D-mannosaminyltransferase